MRQGFRPRVVRQLFARMPAAKSRCLSSFIAIARQDYPPILRYEPSTIFALIGLGLVVIGSPLMLFWSRAGEVVALGWFVLVLAVVALLSQHHLQYGSSRFRLIRSLDEARRIRGLDEAILPESLEFLESCAFQWERVEHALQTQPWQMQPELRFATGSAAQKVMEEIVLLECGNNLETGLDDEDADRRLLTCANTLRLLADAVDAAGSSMATYPRADFDSNGESPSGVSSDMQDLEDSLDRVKDVLSQSATPL